MNAKCNTHLSVAIRRITKNGLITFRRHLAVMLLALLMAGCQTQNGLTRANSALVICHITLSEHLPGAPSPLHSIRTTVRITDSTGLKYVQDLYVDETGGFFKFRLHPGSYSTFEVSFAELTLAGTPIKCTRQRLVAAIEVPQGAPVVYIGHLKLTVVDAAANNIDTSGFWWGSLLTAVQPKANLAYGVQVAVTNDLEAAIQDLKKIAPKEAAMRPVESLMALEKERPTAVLNTALHKVNPINPKPTGVWASRVKSLQPTLSWEAPQASGVQYDLAIYTGISVGRGASRAVDTVPGKEIYYREALDTASHTLETKLLPQTRYVWSVRTRVGTNVSHWSKLTKEALLGGVDGRYWDFTTPTK